MFQTSLSPRTKQLNPYTPTRVYRVLYEQTISPPIADRCKKRHVRAYTSTKRRLKTPLNANKRANRIDTDGPVPDTGKSQPWRVCPGARRRCTRSTATCTTSHRWDPTAGTSLFVRPPHLTIRVRGLHSFFIYLNVSSRSTTSQKQTRIHRVHDLGFEAFESSENGCVKREQTRPRPATPSPARIPREARRGRQTASSIGSSDSPAYPERKVRPRVTRPFADRLKRALFTEVKVGLKEEKKKKEKNKQNVIYVRSG